MSEIIFRDLSGMDEFAAAEELQRVVWGRGDTPDPGDLLMVISHEGGLTGGAFLGEQLVGYVFGFPSRDPTIQHSHRLAVHPDMRGQGLALRLKQYQRTWCLARGISLVRWTFDPLRHTNAHLNVARLGCTISTYHCDYYGVMKGINAGVPSDRLLAEWRVADEHVVRLASGDKVQRNIRVETRIAIPSDFELMLSEDIPAATAERLRVRGEMQTAFGKGLSIVGYDAESHSYLLGRL